MSFDFSIDPFSNFQNSLRDAQIKGIPDHNAMTVATSSIEKTPDGVIAKPSCRIVFFKGFVRGGFSFYTNYNGRKGQDILQNQNIAANFFWSHLDAQFRIDGVVDKLTEDESDQYFWSRARLSQIGAWASHQSDELKSFDEFHLRVAEFEKKFAGGRIPRPPHWGGYRIVPNELEFWFGRNGRLHERYVYSRTDTKGLRVNFFSDYDWRTFLRYP